VPRRKVRKVTFEIDNDDVCTVQALHGQEVLSMRLKVMVAEPNTAEDRRKRLKMEVEWGKLLCLKHLLEADFGLAISF